MTRKPATGGVTVSRLLLPVLLLAALGLLALIGVVVYAAERIDRTSLESSRNLLSELLQSRPEFSVRLQTGAEGARGAEAVTFLGERVDGGLLAGLERRFGFSGLRFVPQGEGAAASAAEASLLLQDAEGRPLGWLRWSPERPGAAQLGSLGLILLATLLAMAGAIGFFVHRASQAVRSVRESVECLREARSRAEQASRAKSTFLANLSHELRTPLNAIIGFSDAMHSGILGPVENPRYRSYLESIKQSGEDLLSLIEQLLQLSRIEAGTVEERFVPVSVDSLVSVTVREAADKAEQSGIHVSEACDPGLPPIRGNDKLLRQMLRAVIDNAIRFTPRGGRATVAARREGAYAVVLEVRDSGCGIPRGEIDKVVEPFYRVQSSELTAGPAGLGLAVARSLVELHQGYLEIDSEEGSGTAVRLHLPAMREPCRGADSPARGRYSANAVLSPEATLTHHFEANS